MRSPRRRGVAVAPACTVALSGAPVDVVVRLPRRRKAAVGPACVMSLSGAAVTVAPACVVVVMTGDMSW